MSTEDSGLQQKKVPLSDGLEMHGFVLQSTDVLEDYDGLGYTFRHRTTNLELYHVANNDAECLFGYIFKTPPLNDSGVPHIIEHCILAGSKLFPVKDPFMALLKGSVNTFMNAMTGPDYTVYPASSVLPKDFMNLFKVYSDAVFNPLLRKETFWQEGVRLVKDEDGTIRFDGVVYNEMKGEMSDHDSIVVRQSIRNLYPDTPYFYDSGGIPQEIVKLDYRQFVSYYGTYYHPSNCRLFVYGNIDIESILASLDKLYLADYSAISGAGPSPLAKRWTKPKTMVVTSPADNEDDGNDASVTISWATTLLEDPVQTVTLSVLTDILLGNPGAPLYKAIIDSHISRDVSDASGMDTGFRQLPFTVGFKGIDPKDAEKAQDLVLSTLKDLVENGIDTQLVTNAVKRHEFNMREISGDAPVGMNAFNRCLRGWIQGYAPHTTIHIRKPLETLKELVNRHADGQGYFEQWIQEHLLDNPHRCLLTVIPDSNHLKNQEEMVKKRIDEIRTTMERGTLEQIEADTVCFEEFEKLRDTPQALATIPRLTVDDLPKDIRILPQDKMLLDSVPLYRQSMHTNDIVYVDGLFYLNDLSEEDHLFLPVLTRLLHMTGVNDLSYDKVAMQIRNLTGALYFYLETSSMLDSETSAMSAFVFRMKCLGSDFPKAVALLSDILVHANVDDTERIVAVINDLISSYEANAISSGHTYAAQRACSVYSPILSQNEKWNGISQWLHLASLDLADRQTVGRIAIILRHLYEKIIDRSKLILHLCTNEPFYTDGISVMEKYVASIPCRSSAHPEDYGKAMNIPFPKEHHHIELFKIPAAVSYSAMVLKSADPMDPKQAHQMVLGYLLTTNQLWERVRGIGGAYGVSASNDLLERLFVFSSYRDPRIDGTLNDFIQVLELVAEHGIDLNLIEQAIISIVGRELKPLYPKEAAMTSFRRALYGISDEYRKQRRSWILNATSDDMRQAAIALLEEARQFSSTVVLAGPAVIDKEAQSQKWTAVKPFKLPL